MDPQSYGSSPTIVVGGSPGLVVMAGDSCSEGHGFKSQHGWTFFHINLLLKHVRFVRKRPQKEAGDDPFKKAIAFCLFTFVGKEARLDSAGRRSKIYFRNKRTCASCDIDTDVV